MKEFGSDFHINNLLGEVDILASKNIDPNYYANGRHSIQALIKLKLKIGEWRRIWIPEYFCYDVVKAINDTGIEIMFYPDHPMSDDQTLIQLIPFQEKDVLLRMNYFGLRSWRDNSNLCIPVIEDHSHDILSEWAIRSNADWCVVSLRKTLPLPEGGILWSPRQYTLPSSLNSTLENDKVSYQRLSAMLLKSLYLSGQLLSKKIFRTLFIETEKELETLSMCGMSNITLSLLKMLNIVELNCRRKENWHYLSTALSGRIEFLSPEIEVDSTPFSFVLKLENKRHRDLVREKLIQKNVYPSVLWEIPSTQNKLIRTYGERLLSVHCDARYTLEDMSELSERILSII